MNSSHENIDKDASFLASYLFSLEGVYNRIGEIILPDPISSLLNRNGSDPLFMKKVFKLAYEIQNQDIEEKRQINITILGKYLDVIYSDYHSNYLDDNSTKNIDMYEAATQLCNFEDHKLWIFVPPVFFQSKEICVIAAKSGCFNILYENTFPSYLSQAELFAEALLSKKSFKNTNERNQAKKNMIDFINKLDEMYNKKIEAEKTYKSVVNFIFKNQIKLVNYFKCFGDEGILYLKSLLATTPLPIERFISTYLPINDNIIHTLEEIFNNINAKPNKSLAGKFANLLSIIEDLPDTHRQKFIDQLQKQNTIYKDIKQHKNLQLKELENLEPHIRKERLKEIKTQVHPKINSMEEFSVWLQKQILSEYIAYLGINPNNISEEKLKKLSADHMIMISQGIRNLEEKNKKFNPYTKEYKAYLIEMITADLSEGSTFENYANDASQSNTELGRALANHNQNCIMVLSNLGINTEKALHYREFREFSYEKMKFRIKQWDKNDINTLFLGNYLSCCLATQGDSFHAIIERRMDVTCMMNVIMNENTNEPICGNWLFLVKDHKGKVYVIANYTEIRDNYARDSTLRNLLVKELCRFTTNFSKAIRAEGFLIRPLTYGNIPDFSSKDNPITGLVFEEYNTIIEKIGGFFNFHTLKTQKENSYFFFSLSKSTFYRPPIMNSLQIAIEDADVESVKSLIEEKIDPNIKDSYGRSSLYIAVQSNNEEIVKILLDNEADPLLTDKKGKNALFIAIKNNNINILKLLISEIDKSKIQTASNKLGWSALMTAVHDKNVNMVVELLQHEIFSQTINMQVEEGYYQGNTALHFALKNDDFEMAQILLSYGAEPTLKNNKDESAINLINTKKMNTKIRWQNCIKLTSSNAKDNFAFTELLNDSSLASLLGNLTLFVCLGPKIIPKERFEKLWNDNVFIAQLVTNKLDLMILNSNFNKEFSQKILINAFDKKWQEKSIISLLDSIPKEFRDQVFNFISNEDILSIDLTIDTLLAIKQWIKPDRYNDILDLMDENVIRKVVENSPSEILNLFENDKEDNEDLIARLTTPESLKIIFQIFMGEKIQIQLYINAFLFIVPKNKYSDSFKLFGFNHIIELIRNVNDLYLGKKLLPDYYPEIISIIVIDEKKLNSIFNSSKIKSLNDLLILKDILPAQKLAEVVSNNRHILSQNLSDIEQLKAIKSLVDNSFWDDFISKEFIQHHALHYLINKYTHDEVTLKSLDSLREFRKLISNEQWNQIFSENKRDLKRVQSSIYEPGYLKKMGEVFSPVQNLALLADIKKINSFDNLIDIKAILSKENECWTQFLDTHGYIICYLIKNPGDLIKLKDILDTDWKDFYKQNINFIIRVTYTDDHFHKSLNVTTLHETKNLLSVDEWEIFINQLTERFDEYVSHVKDLINLKEALSTPEFAKLQDKIHQKIKKSSYRINGIDRDENKSEFQFIKNNLSVEIGILIINYTNKDTLIKCVDNLDDYKFIDMCLNKQKDSLLHSLGSSGFIPLIKTLDDIKTVISITPKPWHEQIFLKLMNNGTLSSIIAEITDKSVDQHTACNFIASLPEINNQEVINFVITSFKLIPDFRSVQDTSKLISEMLAHENMSPHFIAFICTQFGNHFDDVIYLLGNLPDNNQLELINKLPTETLKNYFLPGSYRLNDFIIIEKINEYKKLEEGPNITKCILLGFLKVYADTFEEIQKIYSNPNFFFQPLQGSKQNAETLIQAIVDNTPFENIHFSAGGNNDALEVIYEELKKISNFQLKL